MTTIQGRLASFRPGAVEKTLEVVRRDHPIAGTAIPAPGTELLAVVRQRLLDATEACLHQLAFDFETPALRACLKLLCMAEQPIVHKRAVEIIRFRPRPDLLRPAWSLLVNHYPVERLEVLVAKLGDTHHWKGLAPGPQDVERFEVWFGKEKLLSGMISDFIRTDSKDLDEWLDRNGIDPISNLASQLWIDVLRRAKRKLIEKLGHLTLLTRAKRETSALQRTFQRKYLEEFKNRDGWNEGVLKWIKQQHRVPNVGTHQSEFWRSVSDPVRTEFRRWANEAVLRAYFDEIDDPHGRFVFWKQYIDHVEDAAVELDGQVGLIDFGHFGVVEFSRIGNAAYVYPSSVFDRMRNVWGSNEGGFKDRHRTVARPSKGPNGDGRMIHLSDWQSKYRSWIWELINSQNVR